ncbi:hypothetical protein AAV35_012630 [Salimicrobium jeotgali]|uniref:Uncharacterized protein n=1 Tax=Salimicrobium jeotgali TaxID=1230341 RepID=K2H3Q0_9BACI|nr:hypothetical protein [Salimicrobium jeotgali]AKG05516.1 hypothetical protein AAV35_012630 [Salimicrobium jeotgali]EKE30500.1 hypothetical protein MJ3_13704 [Salimicrobium jeotgali]MBM7696649.1 hypothetical protein [Salimicrobium jeotgali]
MLSSFFKNDIAKYIDEKASRADVVVNGTRYTMPIRRSIVTGSTIRKQVYLTQKDPVGSITNVRLLDVEGNVLDERHDHQYHEENKGLLLEFKYTVEEG